jgi:hypothetical protein
MSYTTAHLIRCVHRWPDKHNVYRVCQSILRVYISTNPEDSFAKPGILQFNIPKRLRQKVVGLEDAVSLVSNGDTVSCSGFVAQGTIFFHFILRTLLNCHRAQYYSFHCSLNRRCTRSSS